MDTTPWMAPLEHSSRRSRMTKSRVAFEAAVAVFEAVDNEFGQAFEPAIRAVCSHYRGRNPAAIVASAWWAFKNDWIDDYDDVDPFCSGGSDFLIAAYSFVAAARMAKRKSGRLLGMRGTLPESQPAEAT